MNTAGYLTKIIALAQRPSVYAAAQLLELPEDTVRNYTLGRSFPDAYACVRIAELLDLDPLKVIADVNAEREKDEVKKARWRELARKLSASALIVIFTAIGSISDSKAASPPPPYSLSEGPSGWYYVKCALRCLAQWFCKRGFGRFPAFGS